ncbi:recombinase family protein [Bradyrhizobium sp. WBOS7]|uniref:Recombinase family protein n=1 Tax=Bradyrhizobium betae TaxID=244734 RepID=A0AAE9NHL8_9BRAD|nr:MULTISPECIES: recombinase family protein [Bradyrhizobium]MDD1569338.1 recombinase family protein [Bradyrhizobium sp. WBOS1]UUO38133.1 recombinase family protein [Bradyrhizobium sp. WBOS01]MDD1529811.1 recombinase family protein [Bradyrhizobium sp. WBOS2]MDD1576457.1 recombinase family protein [Bradyrhizobium sp. WBOS7]MDD1602298.1 recombinase family protein [Bradyrhizobium sp. WBOS16]
MSTALIVHRAHLPRALLNVRAAQYVRMSTDRQQYSIQNQAAVIAAYAHAHNLTLVRTYKDEGESGLLIKNRTGLLQLLEDVENQQADFGHLLVFDVSRWGRFQDVDESAHYEFVCRRAGIKVAYCAEQFENDGSMLASIVKNIKRVMAAEYSRELSAKVYAGQCRLARLGYKPCGRAGYALVRELVDENMKTRRVMKKGERKYILTDHIRIRPGDPMEIAVVRWIFGRFLEVRSETVIAWELNQKELVSSTGAPWTRAAVGIVLRNESYIGNLIFNRKSQKLRQAAVKNPPEQWIRSEGCIEPIIDRELFIRVRKIIEERRVDLTEEEMLVRLRKTLIKEGRLTPAIIDRTAGLPCSATCQTHFGNFRNLYRLLGYTPKRNYEFLDARPVWSKLRAKLVEQAAAAIEAAGGHVSSGGWSDCLRVNRTVCLSVRAARWTPRRKPSHAPHWSIEREACLPDGWIAAIRLSEHNKAILDYVLLPTDGKVKRTIRFSEAARARRGILRFKTATGLVKAIARRLAGARSTSQAAPGAQGKPRATPSKTRLSHGRRR